MKIKRSIEQRLSVTKTWGLVFLMGFSLLAPVTPAMAWDLTIFSQPVAGGTVNASKLTGILPATVVVISAVPNPDYRFSDWVCYDNPVYILGGTFTSTILVQSTNNVDMAFFANFPSTIFNVLNVSNGLGGLSVSPAGAVTNQVRNTTQGISAQALPGFAFDRWTGDIAGIVNEFASSTTITMQGIKNITATYKHRYTYTAFNPLGDISGASITNITEGLPFTATPLRDPVRIDDYRRYTCIGWENGSGDITNTGSTALYAIPAVSASSSNKWVWTNEFKLTVNSDAGFNVISVGPTSYNTMPAETWFPTNAIITLWVTMRPNYQFLSWRIDGADIRLENPMYLTNDKPHSVVAHLSLIGADSDGDGLPDSWESKFGMDPNSTTYRTNPKDPDGPDGDPDNDGLSNLEEFMIQYTNKNWYASPINADTDGDGMDDFYERYSVDPTNSPNQGQSQEQTVSAVLDRGVYLKDNGPQGNRDGDYHWSTNTGYQLTSRPFKNSEEWMGPDQRPPVLYTNLYFAGPGTNQVLFGVATNMYPFTIDNGPIYIMVPNRSPFNIVGPDTLDQSKGNTSFTDGDKFDDGFEFDWDRWQYANKGFNTFENLTNGVTNGVTLEIFRIGVVYGEEVVITNAVPLWDGQTNLTRVFNPAVDYSLSDAGPDGDILYDYESGRVSLDWYTSLSEYNAWKADAFSTTVPGVPHSIRMDTPPPSDFPPKRSSHPFLMDMDKDGLPDGYEVIFGYDPWSPYTPGSVGTDGDDNPDNDWMAKIGTNELAYRNHEVRLINGFDPRVAVDKVCPTPLDVAQGRGSENSPATVEFSNLDELRGPDGIMAMQPSEPGSSADDATSPVLLDSDGDGMWDGWECYVGLNPSLKTDAPTSSDADTLTNLEEFKSFFTSSTNRLALTPLVDWPNKIFPTDPFNDDTDGDGIWDSREKTYFMGDTYGGKTLENRTIAIKYPNVMIRFSPHFTSYGEWSDTCFTGGGLNPTSTDTDGDTFPDAYEQAYKSALDGTVGDTYSDPDGDGLPNYLEYYSCAVYHWQHDIWVNGQTSYDNGDFFTESPHFWDWSLFNFIPMEFPKIKPPLKHSFSGNFPNDPDSDQDSMDDYYEAYHGLNPTYGLIDLVESRLIGGPFDIIDTVADPRVSPYINGSPVMDSDGDGLPNSMEAANYSYSAFTSPGYHTDPTPFWITDTGYERSWVNLYYVPGSIWYWDFPPGPPAYVYDFEENEGFDTDNDGVSDLEELNTTQTDPLSPERPVKRRALYFPPGQKAYARTEPADVPSRTDNGRGYISSLTTEDTLRSFTVEAWVRPINPATGEQQVVVERALYVAVGNSMFLQSGVRLNFRLGIDPDGLPFVAYTGDGDQVVFYEAKASVASKLTATNWVHLCGTYKVPSATEPTDRGVLSLYVNGKLVSQTNPNELPAIGHFGTMGRALVYPGVIMVGATDNMPYVPVGSSNETVNYFSGWVDEIRIWDGDRSANEVASGMNIRMKQKDVLANNEPFIRPQLMCLYDCDNLPDPDHSATAPAGLGFDLTATAIFPADWPYVTFWGSAYERSLVYTDYRYLPWIENTAAHTPVVPCYDIGDPTGIVYTLVGTNIVASVEFPNSWDPYGRKHYTAPEEVGETYIQVNDLLPLGYAAADEDIEMWDNGTVPFTTPFDSDGDGLPDAWEEANGLDPYAATGQNGGNGDKDGDGLSNLAEYLAGTNPNRSDTDGNGFSDYDSRKDDGSRTYGELYDDGDNIPDAWEELYQRPCPTTGKIGLDPKKYNAEQDPDEDGWSNYAEYMGSWRAYIIMTTSNGVGFQGNTNNMVMVPHCDPLDPNRYPVPQIAIRVRYNGRLGNSLLEALPGNGDVRISVYHTPNMDGFPDATLNLFEDNNGDEIPDWWNDRYNTEDAAVGATADPDGDMLNNYQEYLHGTDPWNPDTDGNGITDVYEQNASENLSGAIVRQFTYGHVREGNNYMFAYMDVNNDNQWQPGTEPAGITQFQPVNLGWSEVNNVEIGLTDSMPGYPRFSWPAVANVSTYTVTNASVPSVGKVIKGPRNYWHEGDWLSVGAYGVPAGVAVVLISTNGQIFTNVVAMVPASTLTTPVIVTPYDTILNYAKNELEFRLPESATSYRFQIATSSTGTPLITTTNIVPFRDPNGVSKAVMPFYAGDNYSSAAGVYASNTWVNGRYWVRIQAASPSAVMVSSWSAINLDLQPPASNGASMFSGDIYYFGKVGRGFGAGQVSNLTMIVQAFQSPDFSGVADGQVQVSYKCDVTLPSAKKGIYSIKGLRNDAYYVRAFIDENGNRTLDSWEPVGFASIPDGDGGATPQAIDLRGTSGVNRERIRIVIQDRDTDDDQLPDGWEWMYFGTLSRGPYDTGVTNLTYWGSTNMSLLRCYEIDPMDTDPTAANGDTDGDGVTDFDEICYSDRIAGTLPNVQHYNPYDAVVNPTGTDLNPMKWDTDGDGLSDGYELTRSLNPLDPTDGAAQIVKARETGEVIPGIPAVSQIAAVAPDAGQFSLTWQGQKGMSYEVQYSDDLKIWFAAPNGQRYGAVIQNYVDQSPKVNTRFYRVVVK